MRLTTGWSGCSVIGIPMKRFLRLPSLAGLVVLVVGSTSCATPYWRHRARDAADIVTLTAGLGGGAKARVGPFQAGLVYHNDGVGLRNGVAFTAEPTWKLDPDSEGGGEVMVLYFGGEGSNHGDVVERRGKEFTTISMFVPTGWWETQSLSEVPSHYLGQIEVTAGAGLGVRLGFNPFELVDFLLGWTGVDVMGDDVDGGQPSDPPPPASSAKSTPPAVP